MANISLQGSIRTCKVDTGYAANIESDRFLNPNLSVCPTWNHRDNLGRYVCADSFNTKNAGCNSPLDRVDVENHLRPQYVEYTTLDAAGFQGNFGLQGHAQVIGNCNMSSHCNANQAQHARVAQHAQTGHQASSYRRCSGF